MRFIRSAGSRWRLRLRLTVIVGVLAASIAFVPGAFAADNLQISVSTSTPEQNIPLTFTFSGMAAATNSNGGGPNLYAVVRPAGGIGCQATFGADQAAAGSASQTLIASGNADEVPANTPFSIQENWDPGLGSYIVCAWLETDGNDSSGDQATPSEVAAGPVNTTLNSTGPKVSQLTVTAPASITPGSQYSISYATQTDQSLALDSVVLPAGGAGCASSYEAEKESNQPYEDVFGGDGNPIYGTTTTTGTDEQSNAGAYVICTWIEGPNSSEVDDSSSQNIYVGTAPVATPAPAPTPITTLPSNDFTASKLGYHDGLTWTMNFPSAGALSFRIDATTASGRYEKVKQITTPVRAGERKFVVRLDRAFLSQIRRRGSQIFSLTMAYEPDGGKVRTRLRTVRLYSR